MCSFLCLWHVVHVCEIFIMKGILYKTLYLKQASEESIFSLCVCVFFFSSRFFFCSLLFRHISLWMEFVVVVSVLFFSGRNSGQMNQIEL